MRRAATSVSNLNDATVFVKKITQQNNKTTSKLDISKEFEKRAIHRCILQY